MSDADISSRELIIRVERLEARLTYQDDTIETLNQTITEQWREIDRLKRRVALLGDQLEQAQTNAEAPANEPPPHY